MLNFTITTDGRSALVLAMRHFYRDQSATLICPAYICQSATSLIEADGFNVLYFDICKDLSLPLEEVERLLSTYSKQNLAILVPHYFGVKQENLHILRQLCDRYKVKMIEDHCHSILNIQAAITGDAIISTARKSLDYCFGILVTKGKISIGENNDKLIEKIIPTPPKRTLKLNEILFNLGINPFSEAIDRLRRFKNKMSDLNRVDDLGNIVFQPQSGSLLDFLSNFIETDTIEKEKLGKYFALRKKFKGICQVHPIGTGAIPQCLVLRSNKVSLERIARNKGYNVYRWPGSEIPQCVTKRPSDFPISIGLNKEILCVSLEQRKPIDALVNIFEKPSWE